MMDSLAVLGQAKDAYTAGTQSRLAAANGNFDPSKARQAAQDFEAFFVSQMLEHMWTDVGVDPEFGGGHAEEMWRSMLNQEYGKQIAKRGSLGIANQVYAAMVKAQDVKSSDAPADSLNPPKIRDNREAPSANGVSAAFAAAAYRR